MIDRIAAIIVGASLIVGLATLGYLLSSGLQAFKLLERTVEVKGLSERMVKADTVVWPITFSDAANDLHALYASIQSKTGQIEQYLQQQGVKASEITIGTPDIRDLYAQGYSDSQRVAYRYTANANVTVYTQHLSTVHAAMDSIIDLGKKGIVISGSHYGGSAQYLYTKLNAIKPDMIEEATRNAREVAQKFAEDSDSRLGKIKKARQGQFTITNRDATSPQEKLVRVVSTVEYYLSE